MARIVVMGSINMDFAVRVRERPKGGETAIADKMTLIPGGKGANQACALAVLGAQVTMLGCVGKDSYGDKLLESLRGYGVDTSRVGRPEGADTGMAFVHIDSRGENSITVIPGANNHVERSYIDRNLDAIEACDILVMQMEVPVDTVVYTARKAKEFGKTVILDPAPAPDPFPEELLSYVDIIKPNEHEAAQLSGIPERGEEGAAEAAEALLSRGAGNVVVTLGGKGAFVCAPGNRREMFPCEKVKVVDTTAAGDSFTAAMTVRLAQGDRLSDAVAYANKLATIVVQREGAQSSIPRREELDRLGL